jgi:hypothetical protein
MAHRLKTPKGRATYALRKQTVEPVFGIIKSVMGFRQFLTRGLGNTQNEWTLVCLAWNLKPMAALRPQQGKPVENPRFSPITVVFMQQAALRSFDAGTPGGKSDRLLGGAVLPPRLETPIQSLREGAPAAQRVTGSESVLGECQDRHAPERTQAQPILRFMRT